MARRGIPGQPPCEWLPEGEVEILFLGATSLAGIGVLGGGFLAFAWIGWWLARQDPANRGFLALMALAGFALASSHGGRLIRRADYTPLRDAVEGVCRFFR